MFAASQKIDDISWFALLDFFMRNLPVVIFIEESEDLSQVFRLLLQELICNVELCPFNLLIVVQIISLQQFLFDLISIELFQMFRISRSFNISHTFLNHLQHWIIQSIPDLGVRNSESSLRSALRPYSLNSLYSLFPWYSGQVLKFFISFSVMIPSLSLSIILKNDFVKFSSSK